MRKRTFELIFFFWQIFKMPYLNDEQLVDIREAFMLFDDRGDDRMNRKFLGEAVRAMGLNPTEADLKRCLKDLENTERITFEEFLPIFEDLSKRKDELNLNEDNFVEGLRAFDTSASGTINSGELRYLLTTLGERFTDEEVEILIKGFEDAHGNVNYVEMVRTLLKN
jgi:myosin light chain 6